MSKSKRIGKGDNSFTVLQSDYDSGFSSAKIAVTQNGVTSMQDSHHVKKEVTRIEAIKETKKVKKNGNS